MDECDFEGKTCTCCDKGFEWEQSKFFFCTACTTAGEIILTAV